MASAPAIPAATLVVVRESGASAPDLLMVERAQGMAFAGGALVFPGGRIDDEDRMPGSSDLDSAKVAAIRETLEETAIPVGISPLPDQHLAIEMQRELLDGAPFPKLMERHSLSLDAGALTLFARWVPKFHATRRFDTYFFLARSPGPDWEPRVVEGECSSASWVNAAEALKRDLEGEARLIFPTRRNLERLALHSSFEAMKADAEAHDIEPISPWVEESDGENFITIPEGVGYPVTRERLDGLWRG
jgi:8-oxo-dGTP pyrophosphatase MutT (NUDIX family)